MGSRRGWLNEWAVEEGVVEAVEERKHGEVKVYCSHMTLVLQKVHRDGLPLIASLEEGPCLSSGQPGGEGEGGVMEEEGVIEEAFDEGGVVIEGEGGIEGGGVREDKRVIEKGRVSDETGSVEVEEVKEKSEEAGEKNGKSLFPCVSPPHLLLTWESEGDKEIQPAVERVTESDKHVKEKRIGRSRSRNRRGTEAGAKTGAR